MKRGQRVFVTTCAVLTMLGAIGWWAKDGGFEPLVVLIAAFGTLATVHWPYRPKYMSQRLKGKVNFDYSMNNGVFELGKDELRFETKWSRASDTSIHCYRDQPSVAGVAIAIGASRISDIADAAQYEMSSRTVTPREGEVIVMKNNFGNYAAVRITEIKDRTREDESDEVVLDYIINPHGGTDFA